MAKALALKLLPAEQARLAGVESVDPEVHDLILKAQYISDIEKAAQYFERALAKDPLSGYPRGFYAAVLLFARRYDDALAQANELLRANRNDVLALNVVTMVRHMKQQYAEVIVSNAAYYKLRNWPDVAAAHRKGYAESGYAGAWRQATEVVLAKHGAEPGVAFEVAANYAMSGHGARALDWLERAYAERDPNVLYISVLPIYDPLRAEPRFQALMRQMNLPQ